MTENTSNATADPDERKPRLKKRKKEVVSPRSVLKAMRPVCQTA